MKKIINDITDSQLDEKQAKLEKNEPEGYVPAIIPEYQRIVGLHRDPNWNGACIFTPWEYYQYYGDKTVLISMYPTMKRYLKYLAGCLKAGVLEDYAHLGEWGELEGDTPAVLVATCAYYRMLRIMEQVAGLLEKKEDVFLFKKQAELTNVAFHAHPQCYDKETGTYGSGSQSSYGCVLFSGMVPEEKKADALERLVEVIKEGDYHLSSGEVGLKQVFRVLAENGRNDIVYKMVMNRTAPSYRFFADQGMTALPEYWNCDELWLGMVRSRNHAMMGHVKEWIAYYLLGVKPLEPGFSRVEIEPYLPGELEWMEGAVFTPYGRIWVRCEREGEKVMTRVAAPEGICEVLNKSAG